jgi:hypothetical protein
VTRINVLRVTYHDATFDIFAQRGDHLARHLALFLFLGRRSLSSSRLSSTKETTNSRKELKS